MHGRHLWRQSTAHQIPLLELENVSIMTRRWIDTRIYNSRSFQICRSAGGFLFAIDGKTTRRARPSEVVVEKVGGLKQYLKDNVNVQNSAVAIALYEKRREEKQLKQQESKRSLSRRGWQQQIQTWILSHLKRLERPDISIERRSNKLSKKEIKRESRWTTAEVMPSWPTTKSPKSKV